MTKSELSRRIKALKRNIEYYKRVYPNKPIEGMIEELKELEKSL